MESPKIQERAVRCERCGDAPRKEVRAKTFADGQSQYCYQCLDCGNRVGQWIGKSHPDILKLVDRVPFDEDALTAFHQSRYQSYSIAQQAHQEAAAIEEAERKVRYTAYLKTPAWQTRRDLVLRRANYICEGCGKNRATQVHHTTYDHICNEFLWELVAVCRSCHMRFHEIDGDL